MKNLNLNIVKNDRCGYTCVFEYKGNWYYADESLTLFDGMETMIFPCDENGEVTDWGELYCDRSGMQLKECIEEFIDMLND